MASQLCTTTLDTLTRLVRHHESFTVTLCVLNLVFSLVAALGNLLVIRALWKASSIPANVKKFFLSLAFSDLAVGMLTQPMFGVIIAVLLKKGSTGNYNFVSFCPTTLTVLSGLYILLFCASFLNVTAIAVDRLLAISLHLRYQELVTSKRVMVASVSVWITSGVAALLTTLLPKVNSAVLIHITIVFIGLLLTTIAYIRIYQVVRHHQNQLQLQNTQVMELLRQKKSAYNTFFVYIVYLACYLPTFIWMTVFVTDNFRISFEVASEATLFIYLANSSLNPFVYCWRYREIREIVKSTVKKILHMSENAT